MLSLDDVDALIGSSPRRPTVRMIKDGRPVDPEEYCSSARLGGRLVDGTVDGLRVAALMRGGATVVLQSLHRTWPPAARFADEFAADAGHPVQLNAYLAPAGAQGFGEHADGHEVFALQVFGRKRWSVVGLGDLDVGPGDVLYIPAGVRHRAETIDQPSLHLTLGVFARTYRGVIERLLRDGASDLDLPLPLGHPRERRNRLAVDIEHAVESAISTLRGADVEATVDRVRARGVPIHDRTGFVRAAALADTLGDDDVISWATDCPRAEPISDGHWRLVMGPTTWRVPEVVVPAVVELASARSGRRVSSLVGLDGPSRLVLARRLLAANVCRLAAR
ncbi:JmjC domain-containing protein [Desertimonas flava]|uniref:JmjC domain-containing protein n=1 Tax=Desertimonas flava TaxID=2064846 RepID=UPI000E3531BE